VELSEVGRASEIELFIMGGRGKRNVKSRASRFVKKAGNKGKVKTITRKRGTGTQKHW